MEKKEEKKLHYLLIGYANSKTLEDSKRQWKEILGHISQELEKAREEGKKEYLKEVELMQRFSSRKEIDLTRDEAFKRLVRLLKSKLKDI